MELLAVLIALVVLATPALAIYAVWRQNNLRRQIEDLTLHTSQQVDALRRELLDLRRQAANMQTSAETLAKPAEVGLQVAPVVAAPRPAEPPAVVAPVTPPPAKEERVQTAGVRPPVGDRSKPAFCAWCGTVHVGGVDQCPTKPAQKPPGTPPTPLPQSPRTVPVAPRTVTPPAAPRTTGKPAETLPLESKQPSGDPASSVPASVSAPPSVTPAVPSPLATPAVPISTQPSSRPPAAPMPPAASARVVEPPQFASLHARTEKTRSQQRMKSVFALEETLGTKWLNKLGITLLVLGMAWFGILALQQMGPGGKVSVSYLVSLALLGGGIFLEKRDRYRILGHTLIGGGWALLFFSTYAMNHVEAMRVMGSETTNLILMLAVALAMVVHTLRYRSQLVTGLAFLLAYTTVSLSHDNVYSLISGVILAAGLVTIVLRMEWFELELFGILSSYLTHLYWLYRLLGPEGAGGHAFPEYHASTALLLFYWLMFRISYVARKPRSPVEEHVSTGAALLNTLLLLGTMRFQSVQPELAFLALLIIGTAEFSFGQLPVTRRRREAFVVLSVLGASLMVTAVPFRYSGNNVAILWLIGAEAFLIAGVAVRELVFRRLGLLTGLLVGWHLVFVDYTHLMAARQSVEDLVVSAGVMFALCACVLYANALLVGKRWEDLFRDWPDSQLLLAHSYLGAFAAACAAWAFCIRDWTALALAGLTLALAIIASKLKSIHLQVQYGLIAVLALYRILLINLHTEVASNTHIPTRLTTLPAIAAMFYVTAKYAQLHDDSNQRTLRGAFALTGTILLIFLIYYEVPELWQPVALIGLAVALVEIGQAIEYATLAWHAHLLSGLAVLAALATDLGGTGVWHGISVHALAAFPVVVGAYWIATRIDAPSPHHILISRSAYSWVGTGLMLWVLNEAVAESWVAVSWIIFAIGLALVMRRIGYRQLAWQANVVAAAAAVYAYSVNLQLKGILWPGLSVRMATVSLVGAGLYVLSRKAVLADSAGKRVLTHLHTLAATALLVLLAWYEAPGAWVVSVWAAFALGLAIVDRWFDLEDLGWQAHALAILTLVRSAGINLYINESWHGLSVRLLSLAIVTVILYALCRVIRMPEEWRAKDIHHLYSWAASALVSLLMWYELQPLSVAVGWGVFGLVLFEYGLLRNTKQFRYQSYVAFCAAFGRIFFANLTSGTADQFWGPRIVTVTPLALIFFFVYWQSESDPHASADRRLHLDDLLCYLGTGTVAALLYFQFANDWLATAWAIVVFALFGATLFLKRSTFLHQAILLTIATCTRAVMHNLFGASYFTAGDWTGRYLVLGSAIAVLFGCLPFAFRLRDRYKTETLRIRWLGALVRHPEQFMFFAPVLLLTLMLALKMRAGMVTVAWGIEGVLIILLALALNERSFRLTGMVLLLVCVAKIILRDAWGLAPRDRYVTFIILGAALLLVSFLYTRYREAIRQFL